MKRQLLFTLALVIGLSATVWAQFTVPYTFSPNTRAQSSQVNANFSLLANALDRRGGTMTGSLTTQAVLPDGNNTRDLGASGTRYANIFGAAGDFSGSTPIVLSAQNPFINHTGVGGTGLVVQSTGQINLNLDADNNGNSYFMVQNGAGGTIFRVSEEGWISERGRSLVMGEWTAPSFSAGDFTAQSGSWTVNQGELDWGGTFYTLIGETMSISVFVQTSDVSATPTYLAIDIPGANTADIYASTLGYCVNAGTPIACHVFVEAGGSVIKIAPLTGNWSTTAADNTNVQFSLTFPLQNPS